VSTYDETLERIHRTGPEFGGWLSNHAPMAADALIRLTGGDDVHRWLDRYLRKLEERPRARWPIDPGHWRDPLGDPSRLGDWLEFFQRQLDEEPWTTVLARWWPRLIPGAIAAATHPLIRTGHAVRALQEDPTAPRVRELADALGYWAARWSPLPRTRPQGDAGPDEAIDGLPAVPNREGARTRIAHLWSGPRWAGAAARLEPIPGPDSVYIALDRLVDAAVTKYAVWAPAAPTMLVHMATAPRAARLALPALPRELWPMTYRHAWATTAAIASMYRPYPATELIHPRGLSTDDIAQWATRSGDEHAIKFAEVALESHRRGTTQALTAARLAIVLSESATARS
jgi:hypothetical protein